MSNADTPVIAPKMLILPVTEGASGAAISGAIFISGAKIWFNGGAGAMHLVTSG